MDTFTSLRLSPPYTQDGGVYLLGQGSRDAQRGPPDAAKVTHPSRGCWESTPLLMSIASPQLLPLPP